MLQLSFHDNKRPPVTLDRSRLTIGRDESNDLVLEEEGISGFHAEIQLDDDSIFLIDMDSTNGTCVNGEKVTDRTRIKVWDKLNFDRITAEIINPEKRRPTVIRSAFTQKVNKTVARPALHDCATRVGPAAGPSQNAKSIPTATLEVVKGFDQGRSFEVRPYIATIGRRDDNDIVLPFETVSGCHAMLVFADGAWTIQDRQSVNGVFVNNKKVTSYELESDDQIAIGTVVLQFKIAAFQSGRGRTRRTASVTKVGGAAEKKSSRVSSLVWGLMGFGLAAIIIIATMMVFDWNRTKNTVTPLQASKVWETDLSGRQQPATPALADINGDKFLDVIVADAHGYIVALDGQEGKKIFEVQMADRVLAPPVTGDLTGDGLIDVVVASNAGRIAAVNGQGRILWKTEQDLQLGAVINRPVLEDLNGDKIVDIIVPTAKMGLVAIDGRRGWLIWDTRQMIQGKCITSPIRADVNNDGTMDFVAATDNGQVLTVTTRNSKPWKLWETKVPSNGYASPLYMQVQKRGIVVMATDHKGVFALDALDGNKVWHAQSDSKFFASPLASDVNGDDVPDIILAAEDGKLIILNGLTGNTIWQLALNNGLEATPGLFDVDDDGLQDIIVADGGGGLQMLNITDGDQELNLAITGAHAFSASPVIGDVNNDRMIEVVTASDNGIIVAYGLNRFVTKGQAVWPLFLGNDQHWLQ
ncbi:MAG: FHA domain-containing protein [Desulfobacteraceae bacterium]|jgi:pSer/pThr/pTyr-binding forkhead associated (FHA) protein